MIKLWSLKILLEISICYSLELSLYFILTLGNISLLDPVWEGTFYDIELWFFAMPYNFVQKTLS